MSKPRPLGVLEIETQLNLVPTSSQASGLRTVAYQVLNLKSTSNQTSSQTLADDRWLQPSGVASTELKSAVLAGAKILPVNSQVGFTSEMIVDIDSGTDTWEVNRIASLQNDILSLADPIEFAHAVGATVATQVICKLPYSSAPTDNWNTYPCQKRWTGNPDIYAGQNCITQCAVGYIPDAPLLVCSKSTFVLEPASFLCQPALPCTNAAPASITNAHPTSTCAGSDGTTQSGANCSTQCAQYYKSFPSMVQCSNGRWNVTGNPGVFFNGDETSTGSFSCSKGYAPPIDITLTNPPTTTPVPTAADGIVIGLIIGVLVLCALVGTCCYVATFKRKKNHRAPPPSPEGLPTAEHDAYGKKKSLEEIKAQVMKAAKTKREKDPILDHKQKRGFRAIRVAI